MNAVYMVSLVVAVKRWDNSHMKTLTPEQIKAEIERQLAEREWLTATTNLAIREEVENRFEHPPDNFVQRIEKEVEDRFGKKRLSIIVNALFSAIGALVVVILAIFGWTTWHSIPRQIQDQIAEGWIAPAMTNIVNSKVSLITDGMILEVVRGQMSLNLKDITNTISSLNVITVSNQANLNRLNLAIEYQSIVGRALGYDYEAYITMTNNVYTNVMDLGHILQLWGAISQTIMFDSAMLNSGPITFLGPTNTDFSKFSIDDYRNYFRNARLQYLHSFARRGA